MSEEALRRDDPAEYWQLVLERYFPRGSGQLIFWNLDGRDVSVLIEILGQEDESLHAAAASVFASDPTLAEPALPVLTQALQSDDPRVRGAAIAAIGRIGTVGDAPLPILIEALKHPDPFVRMSAAGWIAGMEPGAEAQAAVDDLIELFGDGYDPFRIVYSGTLAAIGPSASPAIPALKAELQGTKSYIRFSAAEALLRIGDSREAVLFIESVLKNEPSDQRRNAARLLGQMLREFPELSPLFMTACNDPNSRVRVAAILSLRWPEPPPPRLIKAIGERARDEHVLVRIAALRVLHDLGSGSRQELPAIIEALDDHNPDVRWEAAYLLNGMGQGAAPAESALESALEDADAGVRFEAKRALKRIRE